MKRQGPETAEIFTMLTSSEHLPMRVNRGGDEQPLSDIERLEAHAGLVEIAQNPDQVRARCIGCGADVPLLETAMCECGGFVCRTCQADEEEGVCDHEIRTPDDVMDLLDDE